MSEISTATAAKPSPASGAPAVANAMPALPGIGGPSGGFTNAVLHPAGAVTGGISPRHPKNSDGKGDTPDGIGC
ncbi:MAG: hypothetical protein B7Y70_05765 [Rhizobiales bacterium 35-68-8]|nr:MAG: hypothetical protein B7Y70_05765 [Rhizobiales bacterium 35-68-8]